MSYTSPFPFVAACAALAGLACTRGAPRATDRAAEPSATVVRDTHLVSAGAEGRGSGGGAGVPRIVGPEWTLVELEGKPVARDAQGRAPTLTLSADESRASGFAGCNRMAGRYELAGDSLRLGPMAMTRMACPDMRTESAFAAALDATRSFRVAMAGGGAGEGPILELLDGAGRVRARLASDR